MCHKEDVYKKKDIVGANNISTDHLLQICEYVWASVLLSVIHVPLGVKFLLVVLLQYVTLKMMATWLKTSIQSVLVYLFYFEGEAAVGWEKGFTEKTCLGIFNLHPSDRQFPKQHKNAL